MMGRFVLLEFDDPHEAGRWVDDVKKQCRVATIGHSWPMVEDTFIVQVVGTYKGEGDEEVENRG